MTTKATLVSLVLPADKYDEMERLLQTTVPVPDMNGYDYDLLGTVKTGTDSVEVDIKFCNSLDGPYLDFVLFEDGSELAFGEPEYSLLGSTSFEYNGGEIVVSIERGE